MRVPSPPPRRLSRSSIDLRDLEHHCEKLTQADSTSSIFPLKLENYLRYSGSEPLHNEHRSKQCSARELNTKSTAFKANFFQPLLAKANLIRHQYGSDKKSRESIATSASTNNNNSSSNNNNHNNNHNNKDNQTKFSYNNLNNQTTLTTCYNNAKNKSTESFINNLRYGKRKHMTASETDFLRMRNTIHGGIGGGGNSSSDSSSNNESQQKHNHQVHHHRLKQTKYNLIYALSDSDFLSWNLRQNDYSKISNINQSAENKSAGDNNEAIFNRAELLKVILGKGPVPTSTATTTATEYFNITKLRAPSVDTKLEKPDILSGLSDSYDKKYNYIDDDVNENVSGDEIKIDNLVTRSNIHNIDSIIDAALISSCTDFGTILSPVTLLNEDEKIMNTSKSSDAVLMNNERFIQLCDENNSMFLISPPSTPCTPKVNNQDQNLAIHTGQTGSDVKSLTPTTNTFAASDASTISLDLAAAPNSLLQPKCNLKPPSIVTHLNNRQGNINNTGVDGSSSSGSSSGNDANRINNVNCESGNGLQLHTIDIAEENVKNGNYGEGNIDEFCIEQIGGGVNSKKRQSSTVTYNVNVINFGDDDEPTKGPIRNSCGGRSNSSTSK